MSKIDKTLVPKNAQKYADMTKLELLKVISSLDDSNSHLLKQLFVDEGVIPDSVKGLMNKSRYELLQIIARKDVTEVTNQETIKKNEESYDNLFTSYKQLSADYDTIERDYSNAKLTIVIATIVWVLTIIAHFVL